MIVCDVCVRVILIVCVTDCVTFVCTIAIVKRLLRIELYFNVIFNELETKERKMCLTIK